MGDGKSMELLELTPWCCPGARDAHSQLMRLVETGCGQPSSGFITAKSQQNENAF